MKIYNNPNKLLKTLVAIVVSGSLLNACSNTNSIASAISIKANSPIVIQHTITGDLVKKIKFDINNPKPYAYISVYANNKLLIDNLNIPKKGQQILNAIVKFDESGEVKLTIKSNNADITLNNLTFEEVDGLAIPQYQDITVKAGMDKASSIKYGGPTIADIDNDGDYDFIVNNHNAETSKLYWNNGDGTVTKHSKNLSRWFMQDLHGTAAGDYDNDGDLDLVLTMGGGNGKQPTKANFYKNNNGQFVLSTGDVNIDKGGRGRGAKWSDMDLDGDLDLMLLNESSLTHSKPQQLFYKNLGDGTFEYTAIAGLEDQEPSRALITDLNNDNIDDIILYSPLSVWQGNGDFTFTDITSQFPQDIRALKDVMALTDIDIDNDGDLDLYLARGKVFEHGYGEAPSVDHDPITKEFSIKPRGYKGVNEFEFIADGDIKFHKYNYMTQGAFRGKDYPIFLGNKKSSKILKPGEEFDLKQNDAQGWPDDISENGVYFGHLGNGRWKSALVRNGNIFWSFRFSLNGVNDVTLGFEPENRNISDILLKNEGGSFVDASKEWNIPTGGNALGVTTGDFNNDSHQDLFVYRWGLIGSRISDLMLLNTGKGSFETLTMHGANDVGGPGNGDMGQAFDFDLDGDLDLLNGSEDGEWYLYSNESKNLADQGNYALVKVGYAPKSNVDAISAEVIIKTPTHEYRKRVGSAGAVFSQSLLNIVHFGLGKEDVIESIKVRWRNGEDLEILNKKANQLFDTNKIDPQKINIHPSTTDIRKGTSINLHPLILPINADKNVNWSSSNSDVVTVNDEGFITAVGDVNQTAIITATSPINNLSSSSKVNIVKWFTQPLKNISLSAKSTNLIAGESMTINATITPEYADNADLTWISSNTTVATVSGTGVVTSLSKGEVTITAISKSNKKIQESIKLTVEPFVEPFLKIINSEKYDNGTPIVDDNITLNVEYHAGSGNEVISADEGGMRFWLRHFKSKWIPAKDIVLTDASVLKTTSGSAKMVIPLKGATPTAELPEGHFYQLRVSFTSSDGKNHDALIYPVNIVASKQQ
ncbi:FG-GAP-like repeat-containing protein [Colwellia sp. RE-S-Sl-9]